MAKERFVRVYAQGKLDALMIFIDRETGVNYLLDKDGKPVITPIDEIDKKQRTLGDKPITKTYAKLFL